MKITTQEILMRLALIHDLAKQVKIEIERLENDIAKKENTQNNNPQ